MNNQQFIAEFEENVLMVDKGTVQEDTNLNDIEEWDSMAVVATLAYMDSAFNVRVSSQVLNNCKTVNDIISLIAEKLEA